MSNRNSNAIAAAIAIAFSAGAIAAQAISSDEYKAGKERIAAEYRASKATCVGLSDNAKDICRVEAGGKENVARAELEASYKPSEKSRHAVGRAKAEADFAVAKERCEDKADNDKKLCVKEAKAAQTNAKANAKLPMAPGMAGRAADETATSPVAKGETAGEYVDDTLITSKVKAAVLGESSLKSAEINVETYKGTVQMTGFVRSRVDIDKAVAVATAVKGVASVKNDMIVKGRQ